MAAGIINFEIEQGATFQHRLTWKDGNGDPVDVTGYVAKMQIRDKVASVDVLMELSSANGRIILGGDQGTIDLEINAPDSAAIIWKKGVHDLELESPAGVVTRLVEGKVSVSPEVTR